MRAKSSSPMLDADRELESVEVDADDGEETICDKDGLKVAKKPRRRSAAFPLMWLAYSTLFLGLLGALGEGRPRLAQPGPAAQA